MTTDYPSQLEAISQYASDELARRHQQREQALGLCREIIRLSANAIRALHRREFDGANELLAQAALRLDQMTNCLKEYPEIHHAGFLSDAQKEYVEALCVRAFLSTKELPHPQELRVGLAPYLNGLGEAAGELRRYVLDSLRRDDVSRCEELLESMDAIYGVLVSLDFPDALTGGLRRTCDMVRGVLERTRGDLTMALRQRELTERLDAWQERGGCSS